jgi:hypothetical protein
MDPSEPGSEIGAGFFAHLVRHASPTDVEARRQPLRFDRFLAAARALTVSSIIRQQQDTPSKTPYPARFRVDGHPWVVHPNLRPPG